MANNDILFKPNSLILATTNCDDITSNEYKLFDTLLQRCQYYQGYGFREAELNREEIKKIIKHDSNTTVQSIKNTLEKFKSISLRFKLGKQFVSGYAIAEYTYDEENDIFLCSMSNNVFTILMDYAQHGYAPIDLQIVRKARGYYTQKIYQLLRMWSRYNLVINKEFNLEQIKDVCDIPDGSSYDNYKDFRKRVLDPAIKEINEKLNMQVTYQPIKVMRKVQKIQFTFIDFEDRKYKFENIINSKEKTKTEDIKSTSIGSIDYANLIDARINSSIHAKLIEDYNNYKEILSYIERASERTIDAVGGKTINKRNYKYFKTTLESLLPEV